MNPDDPRSDEELVAAANAGEALAFEALYARYRGWVLRVALRFTQDREEAQDVLQETFLYLLRKFPGFELRARLTTFLYPAARNIALTHRRKRRRYAGPGDVPLEALAGASTTPAAVEADLATVLAGLQEAHREVLLLRYVDDMTPTEIAAVLDIPIGTVKSRLHAAVDRLRTHPAARRHFAD